MGLIFTPEETVTILDPRHPLFGRTLPLIGIMNSSTRGPCCVVWIRPTIERHVPVSATDRATHEIQVYPLPLSVPVLQQFLQEYDRVLRARKGAPPDADSVRAAVVAAACLEDIDERSTESRATDLSPDLSVQNGGN